MSYRIIIANGVRADLKDIAKYIAENNPVRAKSFIKELRLYFYDRLREHPLSGKKVKGSVRMLPYKRYIILYIVDSKEKLVRIVNIFAGGKDWQNSL